MLKYEINHIVTRNDKEWHEARSKVITATEMTAILGLDPYSSVSNMLKNKEEKTFTGNAYTIIGNLLEPVVVALTNLFLNTTFTLYETDKGIKHFYTIPKLHMGATPDAINCELDELLECKTTGLKNILKWTYFPPLKYLGQLYIQMMCTNKQKGKLSILNNNLTQYSPKLKLDLPIFQLKRSKIVDQMIEEEVTRFWAARKAGKMFRVDRKKAKVLAIRLRMLTEHV